MPKIEVPYEKPGPPKGTAYGIAAVTQALEGVDFPASRADLLRRAGNQQIEFHKGHPVRLRDILEESDVEEYPSMANVVSAVSDALERKGVPER